jgi:tetratricopeptide (TPR) repeat protein
MRPVSGLRAALRTALATGLGLWLGACATSSYSDFTTQERSVYGAYLAARYAGSARELEASSDLYAQALERAPESGLISQRAFFAALIAGDFANADTAAEAAANDPETAQIADLYWRAVRLGRGREAPQMSIAPIGPFSTLVSSILTDWDTIARGDEPGWARNEIHLEREERIPAEQQAHRALVLEHLGQDDAAQEAYEQALAGVPGLNAFNTLMYGAFLERQGRRDEARALYQSALDGPSSERPDIEAALARVEHGGRAPRQYSPRQAAARALFPPASLISNRASGEYTVLFLRILQRLDPDFDYNTLTIAQLLDSLDLREAALADYNKIDDGPLSEQVEVSRLWLQFRMDQDEALVEEARALVEETPTRSRRLLLADMLRVTDRCSEAVPIYAEVAQAAEAEGAPDWRFEFYHAACVEIAQDWDAAAPLFERALELAPDEPMLLNHLGYNLIVEGEQLERGLGMVQRAVSLEPSNGAYTDSLGWGQFKLGHLDEAIYWLERAVTLSPDSGTNNWHLGDAYAAAGRTLEAQFQWRRSLELDLDDDERALVERRLELGLDAGPADLP